MPTSQSTSAEPPTFRLQTASVTPPTRHLPSKLVMKLLRDRAEIFADRDDGNVPLARWSLCNILSWGHNQAGVRLVVSSEQPCGVAKNAAPPQKAVIRLICTTYDFRTSQGAEIATCLKQNSSVLCDELRAAQALRKAEEHQKSKRAADAYLGDVAIVIPSVKTSQERENHKAEGLHSITTCNDEATQQLLVKIVESHSCMSPMSPAA